MKKTAMLVGAVVGLIALAAAWNSMRANQPAVPAAPPAAQTVAVVKASRQPLTRKMTVTAELVPFQEIEVMAKVAGYVQKMLVDVGDHVRQGQLIAILEVPEMHDDLTRASAAIQRSKADLAKVRDDLNRAQSAYEMAHLTYTRLAAVDKSHSGLVAQQEVDDAHGRDLMAAAQVAAAKSALASAEEQINVSQAEQTKLKTMMGYARVTASFDGVITRRYADNGSMIQAGTASQSQAMPLVRLSENHLLRLILPVPESASALVRPGSTLDVRIPTLSKSFPGKVARVSDKVDTATRTMMVQVDVPNQAGLLIPGMYAEVDLTLESSPNALTVPIAAVREKDGNRSVFVVDADRKVTARRVQTGIESATLAQITSGLSEGDEVIISNTAQLTLGQVVDARVTGGAN